MYQNPFFKKPDEPKPTQLVPPEAASGTAVAQSHKPPGNIKTSPTQELLDIAFEGKHYFRSDMKQAFVALTVHGSKETFKVRSEDFKKYLRWLYYGTYKKIIPGYLIQEVVELLEAKAIYEGLEEPVFKRVANHATAST
jgi:hypothetical protein